MDDFNIEEMMRKLLAAFLAFIMAVAICAVIGMLTGCRSVEYVKVPEYHTEYMTKIDSFVRRDSVYFKDSVYVVQRGDTLYYNKVVYRDRYHNVYKARTDTLIRQDSIRVPYPVERTLTKAERLFIGLGKWAMVLLCAAIVVAVVRVIWWYRNKRC